MKKNLNNTYVWGIYFWHLLFVLSFCERRNIKYNIFLKEFLLHTSQILPCQKCRDSYMEFISLKENFILLETDVPEFIFKSLNFVNSKLDHSLCKSSNFLQQRTINNIDTLPAAHLLNLICILVLNYEHTTIKFKKQKYILFFKKLSFLLQFFPAYRHLNCLCIQKILLALNHSDFKTGDPSIYTPIILFLREFYHISLSIVEFKKRFSYTF